MDKGRILALFLVAMMIPLSGCISDGVDGEQGEQGPQGLLGQTERMVSMESMVTMESMVQMGKTESMVKMESMANSAMISTFDVSARHTLRKWWYRSACWYR